MSLAVRVIPCLDVDGGRVVKGVNFLDLRDAGDPVELARTYAAETRTRIIPNGVDLGLPGDHRREPSHELRLLFVGRSEERKGLPVLLRAFEALVGAAVLSPGAMVVLERDRRHPSPKAEGLSAVDERCYGDTVVARFVAEQTTEQTK